MPFQQPLGIFDFGFLPPNFKGDIQEFTCTALTGASVYQRWIKPVRGSLMTYFLVISGGSGGGGGFSGASTTARGGGGGGGASSISRVIVPTIFLPDELIVNVGRGGAGGTASGTGSTGGLSCVAMGAGTTAANAVPNYLIVGGSTPGAGTAGTGAAAGGGGVAGGTGSQGSIVILGFISTTAGQAGSNGGVQTGAIGTNINPNWILTGGTAAPLTGGAGGAGVNTLNTGFAGGGIIPSVQMDLPDGAIPTTGIGGGLAGSAAAAGNGSGGLQIYKPFFGSGGSGGGSSDGSTGGAGGKGAIGCGGGGGGGGVTGGVGGDGGDGLVVIISW